MSNIKIQDVYQRIQYTATSGQTEFTVPFPFFENTDLTVWQDETELTLTTEYSVTGAGSPSGGLVTLVTGATTGDIITIQGLMPIDRTSIYSPTISNLTGTDLNNDFNRDIVMLKQLETTQEILQLQYKPYVEISQDPDVTTDRWLPLLGPLQVWRMNAANTEIEAVTIDESVIPAPADAAYWVSENNTTLSNEVNMGLLTSGLLKHTVAAGVSTPATAINGTDYWAPGDDLTRASAPTAGADVTNKTYVDALASGLIFLTPVNAASTANFTSTYDNGTAGVGATLTATSNGAFSLDGEAGVLNNRYLMKDQTNTFENGVYVLTQVGDGSTPAILTRSTDFDTPSEIEPGDLVLVIAGTDNAETFWIQTATVNTVGTDPIVFNLFGLNPADMMTLSTNQTVTGDKDFQGSTTVPTPTLGAEAANKDYVDGFVGGGGFAKNVIIGGDFATNPWQRGTNFTPSTNNYTADRWTHPRNNDGVVDILKTQDAPTAAEAGVFTTHCLELDVTTADATIAAGQYELISQRVEGYNFMPLAQNNFTISFWVKAKKTGTYCVAFLNSGADRSYVAEYTVDASDTWEKKTITVTASPSAGTWNYTNGVGLNFAFAVAAGSTYQTTADAWQTGEFYATSNQVNGIDSASNSFRIALVQIEKGDTATLFEIQSAQEVLKKCKRYYQKTFPQGTAPAQNSGTNLGALLYRATTAGVSPAGVGWDFEEEMRTTPTATFYNPAAANTNWRNLSAAADSGASGTAANLSTKRLYAVNAQAAGDLVGANLAVHATVSAEI